MVGQMYVLIIMFVHFDTGGIAIQEFHSQARCQEAAAGIVMVSKPKHIVARCFKK